MDEKPQENFQTTLDMIRKNEMQWDIPRYPDIVFDKLTAQPRILGSFLETLKVVEAPWDTWFQKQFCAKCQEDNCDHCQREERNNPTRWLCALASEAGVDSKEGRYIDLEKENPYE